MFHVVHVLGSVTGASLIYRLRYFSSRITTQSSNSFRHVRAHWLLRPTTRHRNTRASRPHH